MGIMRSVGEEPALLMQPGRDSPNVASVVEVDTQYWELRAAEMRTRRLAESWGRGYQLSTSVTTAESISQRPTPKRDGAILARPWAIAMSWQITDIN